MARFQGPRNGRATVSRGGTRGRRLIGRGGMRTASSRYVCITALFAASLANGADKIAPGGVDSDPRNWPSVGRTASETHYSPLTEINRETVGRLKLAWTLDLDVANAQSTPLAVEGVIY